MKNIKTKNGFFLHLGYDCPCVCHTQKPYKAPCPCLREALEQEKNGELEKEGVEFYA